MDLISRLHELSAEIPDVVEMMRTITTSQGSIQVRDEKEQRRENMKRTAAIGAAAGLGGSYLYGRHKRIKAGRGLDLFFTDHPRSRAAGAAMIGISRAAQVPIDTVRGAKQGILDLLKKVRIR